MCILHTESSTGWGGQETRILHESAGLKCLGVKVIILCQPDSKLAQKAGEVGIDVRIHTIKSSIDIIAIRYIQRLIKEECIDIVCTHSGKDSLVAAIAGRLSLRKPRVVRTRHLALPITSKITYSIFPHKVVTVSEYVRKYLIHEEGIAETKVVSIPTGIDIERFNPDKVKAVSRSEFNIPSGAPVIGTVAILRRKKDHHTLLDAIPIILKEFPDAVFIFAGDGPQREDIERKILEKGIGKNVKLLGFRKDIPEILKMIDLFVLPTLQEALGTSYLEAMAMGKPVVGTKVGGVPEVVMDGISGVLVEPEKSQLLAKAIIELLRDKEKMKRMGRAGEAYVKENYSVDVMVRRLFDFYKSLAGSSI